MLALDRDALASGCWGGEFDGHASGIDGALQPLPELPNPVLTEADRAVARLIAGEIDDAACLQIGIGAMPNAACSLLMDSGVRNLGIHTEMLTHGIIDLYLAGIVTGSARRFIPARSCAVSDSVRTRHPTLATTTPTFPANP